MKKTAGNLLASAGGGIIAGALLAALMLFVISQNNRRRADNSAAPSPTAGVPAAEATPSPPSPPEVSPASSSPDASADGSFVRNAAGQYAVSLPPAYRVAERIMALDRSHAPAAAALVVTTGSSAEEEEYVALIKNLQNDQAATEAPTFLPGKTITVLVVSDQSSRASDAQLAQSQEEITTAQGLSGVRYARVQGLATSDVTYLTLPDKRVVSVQMTYASEEPLFDEKAYSAVLDSLRSL